ncbi:hypothetical protein CC53_gp070 [Rhizobium phage vB_RleS_L338C]|nr:hypothetical protein CC53_gp070 [Rhizobium phage vB_RleS_L338C]AHC30487.1 hypothetical protein L338C_070 [Rhizobium phage vB_RleS_L338C]QNH72200.1 hypothetical protein P11VFA_076 [Rhizobium phage P11VFA]
MRGYIGIIVVMVGVSVGLVTLKYSACRYENLGRLYCAFQSIR